MVESQVFFQNILKKHETPFDVFVLLYKGYKKDRFAFLSERM